MSLGRAIKRVERYRDDIVTHGGTREALSVVVENARTAWIVKAENDRLREGLQEIIDARSRGDFTPLLRKMRALLEGDDRA